MMLGSVRLTRIQRAVLQFVSNKSKRIVVRESNAMYFISIDLEVHVESNTKQNIDSSISSGSKLLILQSIIIN